MKTGITAKTLSEIIDCNYNTLNMYLCRAEFNKFLLRPSPPIFSLEEGFIKELYNLLELKRFITQLENLKSFWEEYNCKK